MNKINLAFVIDRLGTGGTERQLKTIADGLDRRKFNICLIVLRGSEHHYLRPEHCELFLLNMQSLLSWNGIKKTYELIRFLKRKRIHILNTFFQDSTIIGILAAKFAGVDQTVVAIRDMLFWAKGIYFQIYRIFVAFSDIILVNSNAVKERVTPLFPQKKIHVIKNAIKIGEQYGKKMNSRRDLFNALDLDLNSLPVITLVSNCNRTVKRVDLLIEAAPKVLRQHQACFLIIGDGHLRAGLEYRTKELGIEGNIIFAGKRNDVEALLAGSDLALNTSDSEGFSNSVMEAMRAGIPVVASNVGGNRELVKDGITGLLFRPGDPEDLALKILKLLNDKQLASKMGDRSKELIKTEFSEKIIIRQYEFFYQSLFTSR